MASNRDQIRAEHAARREEREAAREERRAIDREKFDILRDGPVERDLGLGQDQVTVRSGRDVSEIRLTISRTEVGNGNPRESGMQAGQDGGLAIRVQAEDAAGALFGPVSRFDDEGVTFRTPGDVRFDIRDISGAPSGVFDVAVFGTTRNEAFDYSDEDEDHYVNAGAGDDVILTGDGDDHPVGGPGNDVIDSGAGDDLLVGGPGVDRIAGGEGDDTAVLNLATDGADAVDLGSGLDTVRVIAAPGQVRLSFAGQEAGNGDANDAGALTNQDGGLAIRLQAESGGAPTGPVSRFDDEGISFVGVTPAITFDVRDLVSGAERGDQFQVVRFGTSGGDVIDDSASMLRAYVNAGMGDDRVNGGAGGDFLVGGAGNDRLNGGGGGDSLGGALGADVFVFAGAAGNDRILDFLSGADRIDLSAYGIGMSSLQVATMGNNAVIGVDANKDGAVDFQITLVNAGPPAANDYIF